MAWITMLFLLYNVNFTEILRLSHVYAMYDICLCILLISHIILLCLRIARSISFRTIITSLGADLE